MFVTSNIIGGAAGNTEFCFTFKFAGSSIDSRCVKSASSPPQRQHPSKYKLKCHLHSIHNIYHHQVMQLTIYNFPFSPPCSNLFAPSSQSTTLQNALI